MRYEPDTHDHTTRCICAPCLRKEAHPALPANPIHADLQRVIGMLNRLLVDDFNRNQKAGRRKQRTP